MIDFNQSLDPAEAICRIARLAPYDLHWIEEPVPQETCPDTPRSARLADADPGRRELVVPARLRRGDRGRRVRLHHAGRDEGRRRHRLMQVAGQADAASIPMSSHLFAEVSAHLLAVTPTAHWLEFLDFAGAILAEPAEIRDGGDRPRSRPRHHLERAGREVHLVS